MKTETRQYRIKPLNHWGRRICFLDNDERQMRFGSREEAQTEIDKTVADADYVFNNSCGGPAYGDMQICRSDFRIVRARRAGRVASWAKPTL